MLIQARTVCPVPLSPGLTWDEWRAAAAGLLPVDVEDFSFCPDPLCSPTGADNGQCFPGRYLTRWIGLAVYVPVLLGATLPLGGVNRLCAIASGRYLTRCASASGRYLTIGWG